MLAAPDQDMDASLDASSPACSGFSAGSLPLRKRARKPKHVYNAASDVRSASPPVPVRPRLVRRPGFQGFLRPGS